MGEEYKNEEPNIINYTSRFTHYGLLITDYGSRITDNMSKIVNQSLQKIMGKG
ncbi:hypothetical protein C5S29_00165 [ANME-1 cluster archaeon GoMg3.2]|nr:hypothetical protein [ANME-1 cluster archaeon GoMg3.2]